MCGRYADFVETQEVLDAFAIAEATDDARLLPPSYNVAPMQVARIVTLTPDASARRLITARWGLVPAWAKDPSMGSKMFNARSETVAEKPSFRAAFSKRRCLVPANGYYEWQATADGKVPHFIHPADGGTVGFAGLWETRQEGDTGTFTFTILTTGARGHLAAIHDRQPVMLTADARDAWLDGDATRDELLAVVASEAPPVVASVVSREVGNVRNNHPGLVEAVGPGAA